MSYQVAEPTQLDASDASSALTRAISDGSFAHALSVASPSNFGGTSVLSISADGGDDGWSVAVIAVIVLGAFAGAALIAGGAVYSCIQKKRKKKALDRTMTGFTPLLPVENIFLFHHQ